MQNKVNDIMRKRDILRLKRNWRKYNSYEGDMGGVKVNEMSQNFKTSFPYEKAGTDISVSFG